MIFKTQIDMKKLLPILLIIIALSCGSEDEVDPRAGTGCLTGIENGTNYRVTIRCCTFQEYAAGNNVASGGTSNWTDYSGHKWEKCPNCN